ncbi:hypothetical protein A2U01_0058706, partial [Trifolium medium]|nr:hypothetical protein [Trifolium medium]
VSQGLGLSFAVLAAAVGAVVLARRKGSNMHLK